MSLGYTYGSEPALHDLDFAIAPGDCVGIVGPSGGGKSTLLQLLARQRLPTGGVIEVDEVDYRDIAMEDWSSFVALVPQTPTSFEGTIFENVCMFREGYDLRAVREAAELAGLDDEVMAMPHQYGRLLDARGGGMSGGQRQRLNIPRAVLGTPSLLLMDEPTSALDMHSEERVSAAIATLKRRNMTVVIVAHRLSTLSMCERLVVVERGRITAEGDREEVLRESPFFRTHGSLHQ